MDADAFDDLAMALSLDNINELFGAFNASEQWHKRNCPDGYDSIDVVRRAWHQLDPGQQAKSMDILFNAYWHMTMSCRRWLEQDQMAQDGKSYLESGDLEIVENTLSGAALMDAEDSGWFSDGFMPIEIAVVQRLVSEIELLQHRLKMREAGDSRG